MNKLKMLLISPMTKQKKPALPIGSTIGILGGGQLGRMLAIAAANLGMKTHIFCPDPNSPAFEVAGCKTVADYTDYASLETFANSVDIVTYEFENVPVETAKNIMQFVPLAPNEKALSISQDRLLEKQFLKSLGVKISEFEPVRSLSDLHSALSIIGTPAVLKTTRLGYDGKGQRIIKSPNDAEQAYTDLAGVELVLEAFIPFEMEISIIIARNEQGKTAIFDPAQNVHKNHILHTSTVPANISLQTEADAKNIASLIAQALNYTGILAIEFFVVGTGDQQYLLVNEIAPRVHNSGHWTQDVCPSDQFDQHIRAICNWPLGDTSRLADVTMTNLIGDDIFSFQGKLLPNEFPHLYGKSQSRLGRKMGHINTIISPKE